MEVEEYGETREELDIRWGGFLSQCGLLPVPVPLKANMEKYFDLIKPHGILLTGGNNLQCMNPNDPLSRVRDDFEFELIDRGIKKQLPIVGVCRGMQMIAHYFGLSITKCSGHVGKSHPIKVNPNTMVGRFFELNSTVNSYHNFCISNNSEKFVTSAKMLDDEVIEGIEHIKQKIIGIMWHPERVDGFLSRDIKLFQYFFFN
jgi:putative glutamine amidotransferase|tara:strand:- start:442 stop:1047 length:606 start_codon:yes stop_codon:yes gene_type:complete